MIDQKKILWLASYPRSGNTFARVCIEAMYGLPCISKYLEPETFLGGSPRPVPVGLPCYPVKTHAKNDAYGLDNKAIYIVRDGRDAIVSHAHYHKWRMKDERPIVEIVERIVSGKVPSYDPGEYWFNWSKHVSAWLNRPIPTALIRFEDLIQNPREMLHQAFTALGYDLQDTGVELPTFNDLKAQSETFFRRGEVGSYRDEMPEALQHLFWKHHGEGMALAGYEKEAIAA